MAGVGVKVFVLCMGLLATLASPAAATFPDNVYVWGDNSNNELGTDEPTSPPMPLPASLFPQLEGLTVSKVAQGRDFSLFLTDDGHVYFSGSDKGASCNVTTLARSMTTNLTLTLMDFDDEVVDIAAAGEHAVYLFADRDTVFVCGLFEKTAYLSLTELFNASVSGVAAGESTAFAYGGGVLLTVGSNEFGQLGQAASSEWLINATTTFVNETVTQVAAGSKHTLVLTEEVGGTATHLYGAGDSSEGQLGLGTGAALTEEWLVLTSPPGVVFVAAGGSNTIFLTSAATNNVWGTGLNDFSQLSTGDRRTRFTPVRSNGGFVTERVEYASVGLVSSALVTESRRVFMTGDNAFGQLGLGDFSLRANGVFVAALPCDVVATVDVYETSTVAVLRNNGAVPDVSLNIEEELLVGVPHAIEHVFDGPLDDYFVTLRYSISGPAVLNKYVARFGECDEDEVIVTCSDIGLVSVIVSGFGVSSESEVRIPCHGTVELDGLQSIPLGGSVTARLTINPPAVEQLDFEVTTANHFIAIPSHTTVTFARGQTVAVVTFTSPANGKIGITSGYLAPSIQNTYQYVAFSIAVTGDMKGSVVSECPSVGLPTTLRVDVNPQAPGTQDIVLALPDGFNASTTFEVPNGQRFGEVEVVPLRPFNSVTAQFSATLYSGSEATFTVLSSFFSDFEGDVLPGTHVPVTISISPVQSVDVRVEIAATNLEIRDHVIFPAGTRSVVLDSTPLEVGVAEITLSNPAGLFCDRTFRRTVGGGPQCEIGEVSNVIGSICVACPVSLDEACSLRGECDYSLCKERSALCNCASSFFGSACQYPRSHADVFDLALDQPLQWLTLVLADDDTSAQLSIPSEIVTVNGTVGDTIGQLHGATYSSNLPHLASAEVGMPRNSFSTPYGFELEATCEDNALETGAFLNPIEVHVNIPAAALSDRSLLQIRPFLWDGSVWVDAPVDCLPGPEDAPQEDLSSLTDIDLETRTVQFFVCDSGQYHLFVVDPEAFGPVVAPGLQTEGRPVETTTGVTGFQPVRPPEPQFTPDNREGEVDRAPISDFSASAASALVPALFVVAAALLLQH